MRLCMRTKFNIFRVHLCFQEKEEKQKPIQNKTKEVDCVHFKWYVLYGSPNDSLLFDRIFTINWKPPQ